MVRRVCLSRGFLAVLLLGAGCGPRIPDRNEYVRIQILTLLRAREKGSDYAEELEKTLKGQGFSREGFEAATQEWFNEEAYQEIRKGGRGFPGEERPLSRSDYMLLRPRIFVRARVRGTRFADELAALAQATGISEAAFRSAANIWVGDDETDRGILEAYAEIAGALRVPWASWTEIRGRPEWETDPGGPWLEALLGERGIAPEDWTAAEDVHGLWEVAEED